MKITDCPYSVGTPEHSKWVKEVLIPPQGEDEELIAEHSARAGAESIGGKLVSEDYSFVDDPYYEWMRKQLKAIHDAFVNSMNEINEQFIGASEVIKKFADEYTRPIGIILDEGGIDVFEEDHKQHQKRIKQTCIPHGKPKSSCRKCNRR